MPARIMALVFACAASGCFGDKVLTVGGGGEVGGAGGVTSAGGEPSDGGGGTSASGGAASGGGGTGGGGGEGGGAATTTGGSGGAGGAGNSCPVARVFVTSTLHPGNFASGQPDAWAHAQSLCDARAVAAGLGTGWEPWLSVGTTGAIDKLTGSGPWLLVDCSTVVAANQVDLTNGDIAHGIDQDELGQLVNINQDVWTGTNADGGPHGDDCVGWTSPFDFGRRGKSNGTGNGWTSSGDDACGNTRRLYCFEP